MIIIFEKDATLDDISDITKRCMNENLSMNF